MPGIVGNLLELETQLCRLLGSYTLSELTCHANMHQLTFEVFRRQQDGANVMLPNQRSNLRSH